MATKLPPGKWSQKYDACRKCGRTSQPHHGKGLCASCSSGRYASEGRERRQAAETPRQRAIRLRKQREWMRAWRAKQASD